MDRTLDHGAGVGATPAERRQPEILIAGAEEPLTSGLCAVVEALSWGVSRAHPHDVETRLNGATMAIVAVQHAASAAAVAERILARAPDTTVIAVASEILATDRAALLGAGITECIPAALAQGGALGTLLGLARENHNLRLRLRSLTAELDAQVAVAETQRRRLAAVVGSLRASASAVAIALRALRTSPRVLLPPGEADVVDSLCGSVAAMFPLFDGLEGKPEVARARFPAKVLRRHG